MRYLLDTNIISELRRRAPSSNVMEWFKEVHESNLFLSCITIGELKSGALKKMKTDKDCGEALIQWIEGIVRDYEEQILNIDVKTCEIWAELLNIDKTNAIDSLLAAQSIESGMTLVTRNIKHFDMFGIKLYNPF